MRYPRVLSIAGSDSGGGAGIQADLKTFSAHGCYGMTAVTAITAQNTQGVTDIHAIPPATLKTQLEAVLGDIGADAVKIGMLHSPEVVSIVAWAIRHFKLDKVVLDPVMVSANGDPLIAPETVNVLVKELFPLVSIITPNLDEAALLLQRPLANQASLDEAARDLIKLGAPAVLLKGAHLPGELIVDILAQADHGSTDAWLRLESTRIPTTNIHGSGCTLSSAIAANMALGKPLAEAVRAGHAYVIKAIAAGATVKTGQGKGPLNHGFAPSPMHLL